MLEQVKRTRGVAGRPWRRPLVSGVAMTAGCRDVLDALIVRKQAKGHGTATWLEGPLLAGALITVLETRGDHWWFLAQGSGQLKEAGYRINRVVTIVDREGRLCCCGRRTGPDQPLPLV